MARKNKTKPEIVQDIRKVQDADARRKIVKEVIYPFLIELNDTIGFSKIFLQSASTALEGAFEGQNRVQKVGDFIPRLKEIFPTGVKEKNSVQNEKYLRLFELLKDETVYSFAVMIQEMPRRIEQMFTYENDKRPILDLDINKLLG